MQYILAKHDDIHLVPVLHFVKHVCNSINYYVMISVGFLSVFLSYRLELNDFGKCPECKNEEIWLSVQ